MSRSTARAASLTGSTKPDRVIGKEDAQRIFDQVQRVPNASLRREWLDRIDTAAGKAALIDLLRRRVSRATTSAPMRQTAAEVRVDYWRSEKISRLCRDLLEQLNAYSSQSGGRRAMDASLHLPEAVARATEALYELQRVHDETRSIAGSRMDRATVAIRRKRSRALPDMVAELVCAFGQIWEAPGSDPCTAGDQAPDRPLLRFIQVSLAAATGRTESRAKISELLSELAADSQPVALVSGRTDTGLPLASS